MAENCHLEEVQQEFNLAVASFLAWKEQFRGIAGKECFGLTLVSFKQCVSQQINLRGNDTRSNKQ